MRGTNNKRAVGRRSLLYPSLNAGGFAQATRCVLGSGRHSLIPFDCTEMLSKGQGVCQWNPASGGRLEGFFVCLLRSNKGSGQQKRPLSQSDLKLELLFGKDVTH